MPLNDSFLHELHTKCDIEEIISQHVVLKNAGRTSKGLCPFHNEKTPSFVVYRDTQSFYCFGCGAGGDVITFVRKMNNLDYIDAVKLLADRAGMQMPEDNSYNDTTTALRRRIFEANREAARFFHKSLFTDEGKQALDYYLGRGLTLKTIKHFGLGYAPDSWDSLYKHLKSLGFSRSEMLSANLVREGRNNSVYDNFRNRVITPIINIRGNVIAFGGRVLDDSKPKYINTSDTLAYKKTHELFGLNFAKDSKSDTLILCEGYMDVIAMHQAGFTNAVACCGTALTNEQVSVISRYCTNVILAYDADEAGQKAVSRAIDMFSHTSLNVRVPTLMGGKDPDEIIKKFGAERFKGMLEGAANDIEYSILKIKNRFNVSTSDGKLAFLKEVLPYLATLSPIEREIYSSKIASELDLSFDTVKVQLDELVKKKTSASKRREFNSIISESGKFDIRFNPTGEYNIRLAKAQERLITLLFYNPDFIKYLNDYDFSEEFIDSPFYKRVYKIIYSRIADDSPIDLTTLSSQFTPDELGHLAYIQMKGTSYANPTDEFVDCIKSIKEEYNKKNQKDVSEMSDDDFRNMFKND